MELFSASYSLVLSLQALYEVMMHDPHQLSHPLLLSSKSLPQNLQFLTPTTITYPVYMYNLRTRKYFMVMAEGDNVLGMVIELIFLRCVFFGLKLTKY